MINILQQRVSKMRLGAASAALALLVVLVLGAATTPSAQAQTFNDLYNFAGPTSDGGYPYGVLVRDTKGNLYGTTYYGGSSSAGTVFVVSKTGTETILYNFTGASDGGYPFTGLVRDAKGNLYGTTSSGGASGYGTVFKVAKGVETVLWSFTGGTTDGCYPYQGLVEDKAGNLYGTTESCGTTGEGTVFKVSKAGKEKVLHSFAGGSTDGEFPFYGNLTMDKTGNIYGVAEAGGADGYGVAYKMNKKGTVTVLYSFAGGTTDGCYPLGSVAVDKTGNVYGTAESCGTGGAGTAWKVSKKGIETVLYSFTDGASDGGYPLSGVARDTKGNVYGTCEVGGASGLGTVFEVSKTGTLTLLHSFSGSDGEIPIGGVNLDAKGNLYGTAADGGTDGYGVVWSLTP